MKASRLISELATGSRRMPTSRARLASRASVLFAPLGLLLLLAGGCNSNFVSVSVAPRAVTVPPGATLAVDGAEITPGNIGNLGIAPDSGDEILVDAQSDPAAHGERYDFIFKAQMRSGSWYPLTQDYLLPNATLKLSIPSSSRGGFLYGTLDKIPPRTNRWTSGTLAGKETALYLSAPSADRIVAYIESDITFDDQKTRHIRLELNLGSAASATVQVAHCAPSALPVAALRICKAATLAVYL